MKVIVFFLLFIFSYASMAQEFELSNKERDSIYVLLQNAFDLNNKSEYVESVGMTKEILSFLKSTKDYELLGKAYNNLGYSYAELKKKDKAFEYSFKARDYFIKAKDTVNIIITDNDIGVTYKDFNMIDEANASFQKALNLGKIFKKDESIVFPSYNIGNNLIVFKQQYKDALPYLMEAIKYAEAANFNVDHAIYGDIYVSLAYAYHKLNDFKKSDFYYKKAYELADRNTYLYVLKDLFEDRAKLYRDSKDYDRALVMMDKYIEIKDSINNINNAAHSKNITAKYKIRESEQKVRHLKKEQEIIESELARSNGFMSLFVMLTGLLLLTTYWIIRKNKELRLSRDVAENLHKEKSDFYSEVSHELRTPLYAVIELSSLLLKEDVKLEHREYLESLNFSGNHLLSLINNVLELNKIESGTVKIELLDFDLKQIISNIIESIEFALSDSNNKIFIDYDDSIPKMLVGDSLKLSQIFINLISNAIKFTNNGSITVKAKKIKEGENDVKIHFEVADTGLGISKEKQGLVFENFYQEHAKIEKSHKGTGLGLSIVQRLIKTLGSEVEIKSEIGKGTTFYFELTFNKSKAKVKPVLQYSSQLKAIAKKKFLIVEDNKINQLVTTKVLERLGIQSQVVDSGRKAIAKIKEESFDCILMDLHMPELDGYETTKLIRDFNTNIVIVALTAASIDGIEEKIKKYKMDGYVFKPFRSADFVAVLNHALYKD